MQSLSVSVIIPTYNSAAFLAEAIASVYQQSLPADEVIVVDDGSTDQTQQVLADQKRLHPTLIICTQPRLGVAAARNSGVRTATSEIVAFLDADDRWHPDKLATQLPLFAQPSVALVYSDMQFIGERTGLFSATIRRGYHRGQVLAALIRENFVPTSTVLLRRASHLAAGGFIEDPARLSIGEDYGLWLRIALQAEFDFVTRPLVDYRVHAGQTTRSAAKNYRCLQTLFNRLTTEPAFSTHRTALRARQLEYTLKYWYARILSRHD